VSVFGDSAQLIVVPQFPAARCHVVKLGLLIKLLVTTAGYRYLLLNYTLVGAVLADNSKNKNDGK